jgi:hypothetical protein
LPTASRSVSTRSFPPRPPMIRTPCATWPSRCAGASRRWSISG